MILGLGSDLVDMARIERVLARYGSRFTHRVFTDEERAYAEAHVHRTAVYARRFAAKEACVKALGTGIGHGIFWRHIGVINTSRGQPTLTLTGAAQRQLDALTPKGTTPHLAVSLADEPPFAQAVVIISAMRDA